MRGLALAAVLAAGDPVDELIGRLGSDDWSERVRATAALQALGKAVEPRLRALRTDDLEVAWRREAVLRHFETLHEGTLFSRIRIGPEGVEVAHAGDAGEAEERGLRVRGTLHPWDRIVRRGVRGGVEEFVCARRDVAWSDGDPAVLEAPLRAEIARPFETGAPDAFHLLARVPLFPGLVPALEDRLKDTPDPVVRDACLRALECQRRNP